jgi:hypothetical protein
MYKTMLYHFSLLVAATWLGTWLNVHLQFGIGGYWSFGSDEFEVILIALIFALVTVSLFFLPISCLVERMVPKRLVKVAVVAAAVAVSIVIGLMFYTVFLGRPFSLVVERDGIFVLCFATVGISYAVARIKQLPI